ncbi:hypothetical protein V9Y38_04125, partial [Klebsiella pneumoniae]|uniref:hypothetical protein n=1 Tax=Klebsiella pneumoniae TaxID=573 RepID=UPI003131BA82
TASFVSGEYFGLAIKLHLTQLGVQLLGCSPVAPPGNPDDCILSAVWAAPRCGFFYVASRHEPPKQLINLANT